MKTITHIFITHAVFLILFSGAALALAQEPATESSPTGDPAVAETAPVKRQDEVRERIAARQKRAEDWQAKVASTTAARQKEVRTNVAERKAQFASTSAARRAEIKANIEERRAQLQDRAQERITKLAANVSNRMDAVTARLQNIADRLDSRITKLKDLGVDTTEAEAALASAQTSIDTAVTTIADIDTAVAEAVESEDIRTAWMQVKDIYLRTKTEIKAAFTDLRATVAALKKAVAEKKLGTGVSPAVRNDQTNHTDTVTPTPKPVVTPTATKASSN